MQPYNHITENLIGVLSPTLYVTTMITWLLQPRYVYANFEEDVFHS